MKGMDDPLDQAIITFAQTTPHTVPTVRYYIEQLMKEEGFTFEKACELYIACLCVGVPVLDVLNLVRSGKRGEFSSLTKGVRVKNKTPR